MASDRQQESAIHTNDASVTNGAPLQGLALCKAGLEPTLVTILAGDDVSVCDQDSITNWLNNRQMMAHHIVANHLRQHLSRENPPQILMVVHGQGGTGKSALLNVISNTFTNENASYLLAKMEMLGVTACVINGQTLHSWASLPVRKAPLDGWVTQPSKEIESQRRNTVGQVLWIIIDEMSMLTMLLLAHLSIVLVLYTQPHFPWMPQFPLEA